ncbi:MAG TPA: hypothetical protein VGC90_05145 [Candidatus Limnocylindrales bacterium]
MPLAVGLGLVAVALVVYTVAHPYRFYNHFVWQADAFLHGRAAIDYPVAATDENHGNDFFQDVLPILNSDGTSTGRGLVPFPPLPAVLLVPFVAIWGLATNDQLIAGVLGAADVGVAWWMLGRVGVGFRARLATAVFFGFGTVFWYTAQLGTTWYFAHVVAVGLTLGAVGVALGRDPASVDADNPSPRHCGDGAIASVRDLIDGPQFLAGLLFGLAGTARLSVLLGAPFFAFVGGGGTWQRRALSAGLGAAIPVAALLLYNLVATGSVVHPAYEFLYRQEALGYPSLNYHADWSIEDLRYIPQNLQIALLSLPVLFPDHVPAALGGGDALCAVAGATRGLFDPTCPIALPRDTGMSILVSSPAFLLVAPALRSLYARSRLVTGAAIAIVLIALVNLMHFSQGWVQVGYRFSNDFIPFALPLVAIGAERMRQHRRLVGGLVVLSVAVNFWGVAMGDLLGW